MSMENRPENPFGFTDREQLFDRITDGRFRAIIGDEQTAIHEVKLSTNSYGEFLFVTASRPSSQERALVTFWGLGQHEYRERWLTKEWFWHRSNPFRETFSQSVSKQEAEEIIQARREEIAPYVSQNVQSGRGRLFEMLADLTDEDGALTEIEDMGDLADLLGDEL